MELLAKSANEGDEQSARTLEEHINDCLQIWQLAQHAFPKASRISGLKSKFWKTLRLSIVLHDTGKAHKEFQLLLRKKANNWNHQRHEFFSIPFVVAALMDDKHLSQVVQWVIAGHHKNYDTLLEKCQRYKLSNSFGMLGTTEDKDTTYEHQFSYVNTSLVISLLKKFSIEVNKIIPQPILKTISEYHKARIRLGNPNYFTVMLLLGGLKWCDHLGSALLKEIKTITDKDFIFLDLKRKTLTEKGLDFYEHQLKCGQTAGNLILTAPTGSGKTESALCWLRHQLTNTGQGRTFYILPFTASINAMYERLDQGFRDNKTGMLHGKLTDYLNNYFDDLQYTIADKKTDIQQIKEQFKSILTPLKVVTPFQLLKHLYGLQGYEQGLFEMAGCYMIFDEIHAYSPEVFAQIKLLLEFSTQQLDARVMIMTATMPRFLRNELVSSIGSHVTIEANQELYNKIKRHRIELRDGLLVDSLDEIKQELRSGKKVLVVCNTVLSAQKVFKELKTASPEMTSLLLHGSFSGADRAKKEKLLSKGNIQLLVGTQAIEVSLDIDYDMIYTEPAPIDALIQRFGRANRAGKKGICPCIVFRQSEESDAFIYSQVTVQKTILALEKITNINNGIIDESVLQQFIDEVYPDWTEKDKQLFDEQYKNLKTALSLLSPMMANKFSEDDFYKQFDGIKVLPQANKEIYVKHLNNFDFINAESQQVQIRKGRYKGWQQTGTIKQDTIAIGSDNKIISIKHLITNKKYTEELGLIANEEDPWNSIEIL